MGNKKEEKRKEKMVEMICSRFNELCERFTLKIQVGGKTMSCVCPTMGELKKTLDFVDNPKTVPNYLTDDSEKAFREKVKSTKEPEVKILRFSMNQYADGYEIYSSGYAIMQFDYCGMKVTIDAAKKLA